MSNGMTIEDDFVGDGWHKVDSKYLPFQPPKIQWGHIYKAWTPDEKIKYLENLCCSMNQGLALIQGERDALNDAIFLKEKQLVSLTQSTQQNTTSLQAEMTKFNEQRQEFRTIISKLDAQLRAIKNGNNN